jgi:hypothetical protein
MARSKRSCIGPVGLSLLFGVMRVINFAHGSFYLLGPILRGRRCNGCTRWAAGSG